MNLFNFDKAFRLKKTKDWSYIYIVIDLHDTMVYGKDHPLYVKGEFTLFPHAEEVLKFWTDHPEVKLILFSSSSSGHIEQFQKFMEPKGVKFDFVNCNTDDDCNLTSDTANFKRKFYYNIILDDRGGFEGDTDWELIRVHFKI